MSYVLPFRSDTMPPPEFIHYVNGLVAVAEVLVIDGSPPPVFRAIDAACAAPVRHLAPDDDLARLRNGKVRGVLTGLRRATHEAIVIADDDVRYELAELEELLSALATADVIRPQNFFRPLPWHTRLDTARSLINRVTGGDWPGTLGVRRSVLMRTGGYSGDVLFENLELVRTVEAAGGRAVCRYDLFVRRLPPSTHHFWRQRVRQAYDEFARPVRLLTALALVPIFVALLLRGAWAWLVVAFIVIPVAAAEIGRRRGRGARVFPASASWWAPVWIAERALCAWAAVGARAALGGIPYSGRILRDAATPRRLLKARSGRRARMSPFDLQL